MTALPRGFRAATQLARIKPSNTSKPDLALLVSDQPGRAHAVFTKNLLLGAHIHVCREHLQRSGGQVRAVLVNSGNANCATGDAGIDDARTACAEVARRVGCPMEQVLFLSTGVIGARLPMDRLLAALPPLVDGLAEGTMDAFSRAIMTTDTFPKTAEAERAGMRVVGAAKGAGMVHPDMATMLGFLLTDAGFGGSPSALLSRVADQSFHRVTVDGDTSPNDTVVLWSSGVMPAAPELLHQEAFTEVGQALSRMIAKDGEGATRLVTVEVRGAASEAEAVLAGRTIATSPLVKTAIHGRDPNWGRILAAAGRSGAKLRTEQARVWVGNAVVYERGQPRPSEEAEAHRHLEQEKEVVVGVDLGLGSAQADVWTCDFSADYVRINADYRS